MPRLPRKRRLRVEWLEDRRVPATWGIAWPDPQHLIASFVPDGTSARGESSQLYQTLDAEVGVGAWEPKILGALQTWAVNSNINIGLVADGGQPLGVAGPAEGDARFGDIRISAEPLPSDVLAITTPYSPAYGTNSGDIILNSNVDFNPNDPGSYDLYTVALHEAGHVFGFADSTDPTSFMYNVYQGAVTGLASGASAAIQSLYGGARGIDAIDGTPVSVNPAKPLNLPGLSANTPSVTMAGDLSAAQNSDYFAFKATGQAAVSVQVQTGGISLLAPKVTVRNAAGQVVGTAAASGPLDGGVMVPLAGLINGQTYTIQVQGATGDAFASGSYDLTVGTMLGSTAQANPTAGAQGFTNSGNGVGPMTVSRPISQSNQRDVFAFRTPASVANGVTIGLQEWGVGLVAPGIIVYNAAGNVVGQATSPGQATSTVSLHLAVVLPNAAYYVEADTGTVNASNFGTYQVSASFAAPSASTSTSFALAVPWFGSAATATTQANTTTTAAANLQTPAGEAPLSRYEAIEGIAASQSQEFYRLTPPKLPPNQSEFMTISVQTLGVGSLQPWIGVFDQAGNAVNAQLLTEQDGIAVVQVAVTATIKQFTVEVSSAQVGGTQAMGNFFLDATFGSAAATLDTLASGNLASAPAGSATAQASTTFFVAQSELYSFVLEGSGANTGTDAILRLTLLDSWGNVVTTLSTPAGLGASAVVFLPPGNYTILMGAYSPSNQPIPSLGYTLDGTNLTDPIRVVPTSGSGGANGGSGGATCPG